MAAERKVGEKVNEVAAFTIASVTGLSLAWGLVQLADKWANPPSPQTRTAVAPRVLTAPTPASRVAITGLPPSPFEERPLYKDPDAPRPIDLDDSHYDFPRKPVDTEGMPANFLYLLRDAEFMDWVKTKTLSGSTLRLMDYGETLQGYVKPSIGLHSRKLPDFNSPILPPEYSLLGGYLYPFRTEIQEFRDGQMQNTWMMHFFEDPDGTATLGFNAEQIGPSFDKYGMPNMDDDHHNYITPYRPAPPANQQPPSVTKLVLDPFAEYQFPESQHPPFPIDVGLVNLANSEFFKTWAKAQIEQGKQIALVSYSEFNVGEVESEIGLKWRLLPDLNGPETQSPGWMKYHQSVYWQYQVEVFDLNSFDVEDYLMINVPSTDPYLPPSIHTEPGEEPVDVPIFAVINHPQYGNQELVKVTKEGSGGHEYVYAWDINYVAEKEAA